MLDSDTLARMPDIDFRALVAAVHTEQVRRAGVELADAILALQHAMHFNALEADLFVVAPLSPGAEPTVTSVEGDRFGISLARGGLAFETDRTERIDRAVGQYLRLRTELAESDLLLQVCLASKAVTCTALQAEALTA
jgi:hypothetical protein